MDSNKKVIVAIVVVVLIVGVVIGALAVSNNNSTPTKPEPEPEPTVPQEVHYKFTKMEITDYCPFVSKSRDVVMKQFEEKDESRPDQKLFSPFIESEYKWVKITVEYEIINSYMYFWKDYENPTRFYPTYTDSSSGHEEIGHYVGYNPYNMFTVYTDGYREWTRVEHQSGTVDLWYLLPPIWNGCHNYGPGSIPWEDVTMDMIGIKVCGAGKVIPMD